MRKPSRAARRNPSEGVHYERIGCVHSIFVAFSPVNASPAKDGNVYVAGIKFDTEAPPTKALRSNQRAARPEEGDDDEGDDD